MDHKILKQAKIIFIAGILLIAISPFLLTRKLGLIDFSKTGDIGDTIGGITAPIASLLGSLLIYYALRAQLEANNLVQKQIQDQQEGEANKKQMQLLLDQFRILREDVTAFTQITYKADLHGEKKTATFLTRKGGDAFRQVIVGMKQFETNVHFLDLYEINPKLEEIKSILLAFDTYLSKLSSAKLPEEDKAFLQNLVSYQFNSTIKPAFRGMEDFKASLQAPCMICNKVHQGVPDEMFKILASINSKIVGTLDNKE